MIPSADIEMTNAMGRGMIAPFNILAMVLVSVIAGSKLAIKISS
jgi:hypothetical protein